MDIPPISRAGLMFRIRAMILFYIAVILASGITAFPLNWELSILVDWFGQGSWIGARFPAAAEWFGFIKEGLDFNAEKYPFIACGTDWLAFAHIMIAIAFLGPLYDPMKNIWIIYWGMLCCVGILPLSLICGPMRGIPFAWQCVDCSFGVFGIIPLLMVWRWIKQVQTQK